VKVYGDDVVRISFDDIDDADGIESYCNKKEAVSKIRYLHLSE
jgi:hypothetical protein